MFSFNHNDTDDDYDGTDDGNLMRLQQKKRMDEGKNIDRTTKTERNIKSKYRYFFYLRQDYI